MKQNRALLFIFITVLIDVIGFGVVIPVFPTLLEELTGKTLSEASLIGGLLMFSYSIMQFVFAPIIGGLSDKFGRRPVLLLSLFGLAVDYVFHAVAPTVWLLLIGRVLAGVCGASYTVATAYIADVSEPEKRAQNFGLVGVAFGLGFIIGPVIGGIFSQFGSRFPFFIAAGLTFLNMIYGYFVLPESLKKENRRAFDLSRANPVGSLRELGNYPSLIGIVAIIFLINFAGQAIHTIWTFFTMLQFNWDETMVGYSLGFVGLVIGVVQGGLIRIILPKFGYKKTIYLGMTLSILGLAGLAFATQGWMMFVVLVPYAMGGLAGSALQGLASNQVLDNQQGELQGAITSLFSLASIVGPIVMSGLFYFFTSKRSAVYFPGASFFLALIIELISLILLVRILSKFKDLSINQSIR